MDVINYRVKTNRYSGFLKDFAVLVRMRMFK